ncbi:MAG: hypothetical protein JWL76_2129 [Thermoleophilia bacterium]|nr:hypothetical protein [Thermoleophilia bacterium]
MPIAWIPPDLTDLTSRYSAGESENSLAKTHGVSRGVIRRTLLANGIEPRGSAAANRLLANSRTPEQHRASVAAAHEARRGQRDSFETLCRRAATRQKRQLGMSPYEQLLAAWLTERGLDATPQRAIGPYNADLGVEGVAVEVYGGRWHNSGRHAERAPRRCRYILEEGWSLLVIWVDARSHPLTEATADRVVELVEQTRRGAREYQVVWGDGSPAPASGREVELDVISPPR